MTAPTRATTHYLPEVVAPDDGSLADDLIEAVKGVTKRWQKQKRAEIKDNRAAARRQEAMNRSRKVSLKDAAFEIMEEAYLRGERQQYAARQCSADHVRRPRLTSRSGPASC